MTLSQREKGVMDMTQTGVRLEISPEIIQRLRASSAGLWVAAHGDGSDNRVNWNAVADAVTIETSLGVITAIFQGLRKAFRNRGKTKADFAAEKEAVQINRTCGVLEQMLLEYIEAAQAGSVDRESLDELIGALEEMDGYQQAGKLTVPGERELLALCRSIATYTAAMTEGGDTRSVQRLEMTVGRAFRLMREQLIRQREWIGKADAAR